MKPSIPSTTLKILAGACGLGTALTMAGACAQDTAPPVIAQATPAKPTASDGIAEVIVTAQRRSESVQKSSLAIEVFSGDALQDAGVVQARDLVKLVPGIQIGQGGPATQIYVRGVGDFTSTPITNPAVAVNVDGVYVARSQSVEGNFYDLERIEVLKGPQGTLYGRNASGGAINVITSKPTLDHASADVRIELGDYGLVKTEVAANVPVNPMLALRAAVQVVKRNGYATQGMDDDRHQSARLQALFKPSADLSLRLSADSTHVGGNGPAYVFLGVDSTLAASLAAQGVAPPSNPRANGTDPSIQQLYYAIGVALARCIPSGALAAAPGAPQGLCPAGQSSLISPPGNALFGDTAYIDNHFNNASAELNWNLGPAMLTVLPAYRKVVNRYVGYPVVTYNDSAFGQPEKSDSKSLEARLSNDGEQLNWVAGLYHFSEDQSATTVSNAGVILGRGTNQYVLNSDSYAAFGQASYRVSAALRLIGGLRYTSDKKAIDGQNLTGGPALAFVAGQPCYLKADPCLRDSFKGQQTFRNTSYKVGTEYDLSAANMVFATLSTGYKSGGANPVSQAGTSNVASFFGPEKLTALEIGSRNRLLGNRLRLNIEGFYWKYKDAQEFYSTLNAAGNSVNSLANAGKATMFGTDVDLTYKATPLDTLHLGIELLHTRFDSFVYRAAGTLAGITTTCGVTNAQPFQTIDCSGKPLPRAPRYSGTASWAHRFNLPNDGALDATLSAQYSGSRYLTVDYTDAVKAASYVAGDFQLSYAPPAGEWTLAAFVRNLGDAKIYTGAYTIPGLYRGLAMANLGAPRTFGASLSMHF